MARRQPIKIDRPEPAASRTPRRLLNLGPKSSAWLEAVGIRNRDRLRALGPVETCRVLRQAGYPVSVLMAYAIEGALTDTAWQDLPVETKRWLRAEFAHMKCGRRPPG